MTNSERRISRQRKFLPEPGESRADWWIVTRGRAAHGLRRRSSPYESPAAIFREHARLSAFENGGARDFDIGALAEIGDAEYDALEPFQWPRPVPAAARRRSRLFADGRFFTRSGKAQFVATAPRAPAHRPDADYPLVLNTGRIRDQWHTMTRTGRSPRLTGHNPEPFVQVHPLDAKRFGLTTGDLADVRSAIGRIVVRLEISDAVVPGQVFAPMHWSDRVRERSRASAR